MTRVIRAFIRAWPIVFPALLAWAACFISGPRRAQAVAVIIASLFSLAGCAGVLLGKRGRLDCREMHGQMMAVKSCLATLPKPTLAWGNQASLPWINPNDENHFVLGAAYYSIPIDRRERGDHGGSTKHDECQRWPAVSAGECVRGVPRTARGVQPHARAELLVCVYGAGWRKRPATR